MTHAEKIDYARERLAMAAAMSDVSEIKKWAQHVEELVAIHFGPSIQTPIGSGDYVDGFWGRILEAERGK